MLRKDPALDNVFKSYAFGMPDGVDPLSAENNERDVFGTPRSEDVFDDARSFTGRFEIPLKARFAISEVVSRQDVIIRNHTDMGIGKQWTLFVLNTMTGIVP